LPAAADTSRNVAVVFGGSSNLSFAAVNRETWEYNGTGWLLVNQAGPSARCDNAMAYDSIRQRVVSTA
jgi:glycine betaine/choline ABC-type transport system substrate-binding protein